jgi:hypothetical protein
MYGTVIIEYTKNFRIISLLGVNVKAQSFMYIWNCNNIRTVEGMEVYGHVFLIPVLDQGKWSAFALER